MMKHVCMIARQDSRYCSKNMKFIIDSTDMTAERLG